MKPYQKNVHPFLTDETPLGKTAGGGGHWLLENYRAGEPSQSLIEIDVFERNAFAIPP